MTTSNFKAALEREISHICSQHGFNESKAFLFWFATSIFEIDEDSALEAISVEGANDKAIDLLYIDDDEGRIFIAQGKYSRNLQYHAKETDVANIESSLNWLSSPEALEKEGKPELAELAKEYQEALKEGYGVELLYVYTGKKSFNVDKKIAVFNQNEENILRRRNFRHYHLELLQDLWDEIQGGRRRIQKDSIEVSENEYIQMQGKFGNALVANISCKEIVRLYNQYGDKLFDRNVRLFLGARKGSVNAGIAETIKDTKDRGNFWAYNNGITIICDQFSVKEKKVNLSNFSIVNGCQTTVSLADNKGDSPELFVLIRFIAASADIVDNVIRFTNSQNPIRTWDIASQEKTQRRLKNDFKKLKKPYIYLTRRGDKPIGSLQKYRDGNNRLRQIRIDIVGQYLAAFKGDPVLAYKHKAFVFSKHHDEIFPMDIRAEEVLFCWICGEVSKSVVWEMMKNKPEDVRILKKGGTLFTMAALSEVAKARNGATYLSSLSEEQISSARAKERLKKYAEYSARLYVSAVIDESEIQKDELNTLIRQKDFFQKVLSRAKRQYEKDSLNKEWLKGVLPKLT